MGIFKRKTPPEERADLAVPDEAGILRAALGITQTSKEMAKQIPAVSSAIGLIGGIVASTPIKLYKEDGEQTEEIRGDPRVRLLNDDTGDTLNASEFWRAMLNDYFLGKGGYAYIKKENGEIAKLLYVDESYVAIQKNADPIFKSYNINVNGTPYLPFDFLKILRNSNDGASGTPIYKDNSQIFGVMYDSLIFESALVKKGGNKKGFLTSEKPLAEPAMETLRQKFRQLYGNNEENVLVLNSGMDFKESSNTSVEMQLNENKKTNTEEICKLFHLSPAILSGKATDAEMSSFVKIAIVPLLKIIECALNRDLLLEVEKKSYYFAFDTKELLKGSLLDRYKAYEIAVKNGWKMLNEIRYLEDDEAIEGLNVISMNLANVIYDPATGKYFTPNTKEITDTKTLLKGGEKE